MYFVTVLVVLASIQEMYETASVDVTSHAFVTKVLANDLCENIIERYSNSFSEDTLNELVNNLLARLSTSNYACESIDHYNKMQVVVEKVTNLSDVHSFINTESTVMVR